MTAAGVLASALADAVVAADPIGVVLSPGSRNTPLALALDARLGDRTVVVVDERAAGFVALGMARASGRLAVVVCTSGSAGAHYLPAVVEARYGRVPLLVMTADRPAELQHVGAPQTIDQGDMFGAYVTGARHIVADAPLRWAQLMTSQVIDSACGSPPGPAHLNVAFRKPLYEASDALTAATDPVPRIHRGTLTPDPQQLTALETLLSSAGVRGVIVCGPLAPATLDPNRFRRAVHRLAAKLGWPVIAEPSSQLRFTHENLDGLVDNADLLLRHEPTANLLSPKVVLQFGQTPTSKSVSQWLDRLPTDHDRILVDADGRWCDPGVRAGHLVVADPVVTAERLADLLAEQAPPVDSAEQNAWMHKWLLRSETVREVLELHVSYGLWEGRVAAELTQGLDSQTSLWTASSMPIRDVDQFGSRAERDIAVLASRGCNGIDGTIASATGAALARPERKTQALLGDLAFLHDVGGLHAAAQLNAPVGLIVVDNSGGGIFSFLPIAELESNRFERLFLTPQVIDMKAISASVGATLHTVRTEAELQPMLEKHLQCEGLSILHVVVDREENVRRHHDVYEAVIEALELLEFEAQRDRRNVGHLAGGQR